MISEAGARELVLYHTAGCHLCELASAIALPLAAAGGVRVRRVDIADSDALMARYGSRIPVLCNARALGAELDWPFDESAVRRLLGGLI